MELFCVGNILPLVGGFNPSEKYQSNGMIIPNIWENKSQVPVTTNQTTCLSLFSLSKENVFWGFIPHFQTHIMHMKSVVVVQWPFELFDHV